MLVSEVLTEVLSLLGPSGEHWRKGGFYFKGNERVARNARGTDGFCLMGAVFTVTGDGNLHRGSIHDALALGCGTSRFALFNDNPNRTFAEVKAAIDKAIEFAKQSEGDTHPSSEVTT